MIQNLKLYYADVDADGKWVNIKECPYNSQAFSVGHPTLSADGKTLYFASNGHPGMGGLDIYMSRKLEDDSWSKPINLGYPVII